MDLLLSLQSADELWTAAEFPFRWLDLKNPSAGSLGCPSSKVACDFLDTADELSNRRLLTLSVAIGELTEGISEFDSDRPPNHFSMPIAADTINRFDFVKVALAKTHPSCLRTDQKQVVEGEAWIELATSLSGQLSSPSKLILVHYADHHLAGSVEWERVLWASHLLGCEYILIDTFNKTAGSLADWLSTEDCQRYASQADVHGLKLSLAGSLRLEDLLRLEKTGASIIGIRGAACRDASRTSSLCRDRLQALSKCFDVVDY